MNLRDLMTEAGNLTVLTDAPTGRLVADEDGVPDDPSGYEVLSVYRAGGYVWAAVRGPSGQIDVWGPEGGDLHRDALAEGTEAELAAWVEENYPG